ncbi:AI-2E family transporter [Allorhodopirellula heiligendammensis]|uniref:Inner membrane protein n=1 Tax=Allorhodopirellula heiligendammensis TaxID=2714739 RepID=A0A5C6C5Y5_9BACT|nr:AI-2E family transporter [Allorhodopirellula heiligendammensis]TWU19417.1 putative inner membrane protein [Allorhodopirellula heiligendammensis]
MSKRRSRAKNQSARETSARETGAKETGEVTHEASGATLGEKAAGEPTGKQTVTPPSNVPPVCGPMAGGADPTEPSSAPPHHEKYVTERIALDASGGGKQAFFPQLPSLSRIMSVVMLVIGILAVGVLFYQVMVGFFVPLFMAALLVVIFRPVYMWLLQQTKQRRRLSAGLTTALVLFIVLLPLGMLISIATTQFTVLLSRMNGSASVARDQIRDQLGLSLPHAEYFRALDRITDTMGVGGAVQTERSTASSADNRDDLLERAQELDKAAAIVSYLQEDVAGPESAVDAAAQAVTNIHNFSAALRETAKQETEADRIGQTNPLLRLDVSEQFEQDAVKTAASIRAWMHLKLGGAMLSQLKLLVNPDEADFTRLIRGARESLQPRFVKLTSATGSMLAKILFGLAILVISVYFFLIDGPAMTSTLMRLSPLDDAYERQLLTQFDRTSRAVVLASVASAAVQGILATFGFWLCGFDQIILLLFLTSLMALIPFLGAASVWVPCVLWLGFVEQRWLAAGLLALWGAAVVSSIDNVIKVYVLQGRSQLHPLFALLSVIGGVSVFGPIGILVGPMVVVFLQTMLEILNHEIQDF